MNSSLSQLFGSLEKEQQPRPDLASCSECTWKGSVSECGIEDDGDWETGYYEVHICPVCEDGGCIDDYDYTKEQFNLWEKWNEAH